MPGTVNRRGGTPTHRPSRAPAGAHRPRSLFELQDVGSVATNAVKPHPCPRFHLACRRYRWLAAAPSSYRPARCRKCIYNRGKTALVYPLPSCFRTALGACPKGDSRRRSPTCPPTRSLRARPFVGGSAQAMRRRMGRPGPSRRSDCAVGARAFKSRSLPGCDSPQGRVAAPVRAPIARGPRPARACRATLARGPRASASFYPLALDQRGHDPSGHAHRPVGRRCGAWRRSTSR